VGNGRDEFGFPTGLIPIEAEAGPACIMLEAKEATTKKGLSIAMGLPAGCALNTPCILGQASYKAGTASINYFTTALDARAWRDCKAYVKNADISVFTSGDRCRILWFTSTDEARVMIATPRPVPAASWHTMPEASKIEVMANIAGSVIYKFVYHPYSVLLCDVNGQPLAYVVPESFEYHKEPNMPGEVRITISKDDLAVDVLDKFAEGYLYKMMSKWQGIVPDKRSIGGHEIVLDCLTFEALLGRWRVPRDWTYGTTGLSDSMRSVVESDTVVYNKTNYIEFEAAEKENCTIYNHVGQQCFIVMGRYENDETSASSVTFTWEFDELTEPNRVLWRMSTDTANREIVYSFQVSYDGSTWTDWTSAGCFEDLAPGIHEISESFMHYGLGKVKKIRFKLEAPYFNGCSTVNLFGIELYSERDTGYKLTHKVNDSDALPGVYKFDNTTALETLGSLCSDSGYSLRVTPGKEVIVDRPSSDNPWVLCVGFDEIYGGAEVLEAFTWGEASISNDLIVKGFGDGTGALAIHKKDEASIERYGERPAIASNPMITNVSLQNSIAEGILSELAWPRPYIRLKMTVPEKQGYPQAPWVNDIKVEDSVMVYWPGNIQYGADAIGTGELFHVTEERRSWDAAKGEVVELSLARKPAAQDKAVGVTQIPIPVDADKTAVRITLGSAKR